MSQKLLPSLASFLQEFAEEEVPGSVVKVDRYSRNSLKTVFGYYQSEHFNTNCNHFKYIGDDDDDDVESGYLTSKNCQELHKVMNQILRNDMISSESTRLCMNKLYKVTEEMEYEEKYGIKYTKSSNKNHGLSYKEDERLKHDLNKIRTAFQIKGHFYLEIHDNLGNNTATCTSSPERKCELPKKGKDNKTDKRINKCQSRIPATNTRDIIYRNTTGMPTLLSYTRRSDPSLIYSEVPSLPTRYTGEHSLPARNTGKLSLLANIKKKTFTSARKPQRNASPPRPPRNAGMKHTPTKALSSPIRRLNIYERIPGDTSSNSNASFLRDNNRSLAPNADTSSEGSYHVPNTYIPMRGKPIKPWSNYVTRPLSPRNDGRTLVETEDNYSIHYMPSAAISSHHSGAGGAAESSANTCTSLTDTASSRRGEHIYDPLLFHLMHHHLQEGISRGRLQGKHASKVLLQATGLSKGIAYSP